MKVLKSENKTMMIACGSCCSNCPRIGVTENDAKFADDYSGKLRTSKKLLSRVFSRL